MDDQNRNLILATALSMLVILVWFLLFPPPEEPPAPQTADSTAISDTGTAEPSLSPAADPALTEAPAEVGAPTTEAAALEDAPRVAIDTPSLEGSITLYGGRIDDLALKNYRETLDPASPLVRHLTPVGEANAYYALHGWIALSGADPEAVPDDSTIWQIESGETLTPDAPVTLRWDNGAGLIFRKSFAVDENFMFTVTQSVENTSAADVALRPYGQVRRHGEPDTIGFFILHEGVVRMSDGTLEEIDYDDVPDLSAEDGRVDVETNGWIGFTDKYWMTTLIPEPGSEFRSVARFAGGIYLTEAVYPPLNVAAGQSVSAESQLFAGAKEWETIRNYEAGREIGSLGESFAYGLGFSDATGIEGFIDSIDWGWFFFLTKPIFWLLHNINAGIGNMGWSIIVLTLIIKAMLLPLAYRSYVSMAKMKELQPEMEKLKERAGDDRQALQQGMMELYKKNKVNPASGCLPILLQIPIFFSLYKVIFVTLELRHAPWFGPFQDLATPDPTSIINFFGLLPWAAPVPGSIMSLVFIGILPILLGVSMWLQQKLNPAPTDPTQKMIFAWLPWVFMFMLGGFASGLVLYWIANNVITFIQQYAIMRSQGYKPDILGNIRGGEEKKPDKPSDGKK